MTSSHPFEPFIPVRATRLIIGTIPPARFCNPFPALYDSDVNFYYGSRDNAFWTILSEVFKEELFRQNTSEAIEQREKLLEKHGLGITDVISECTHENGSASDEDLKGIVHKDLRTLLKTHPAVNTLIYTSEFVKKQINAIFNTHHSIDRTNKKKQTIKIDGKVYQVRILYSPSPNGLRNLGKNGKDKRLSQYKEFLEM